MRSWVPQCHRTPHRRRSRPWRRSALAAPLAAHGALATPCAACCWFARWSCGRRLSLQVSPRWRSKGLETNLAQATPVTNYRSRPHVRKMVVGTSAAATMASQNDKALQLPDPPRRDVRSPLLVSFCACVLPLCIDAAIARAVCSMLSGRLDCVWRAERGGVRQWLLTGVEMLLCSTGQRSMACRWSDESRLNFPSALFFVLAGAGQVLCNANYL